MKRLAIALALAAAAIVPPAASAAVNVSITAPAAGAHSLSGVVPVIVSASADQGIYSVQLEVDGALYGIPDSMPINPYQYEIDWDTTGLAPGDHTLAVVATDWSQSGGGVRQVSDPVTVDVGPAYPTVTLSAPPAYTFARGTVHVDASTSSAVAPTTVTYAVDSAPLSSSTWNTTTTGDGSHTVSATVTDGRGKSATASVPVTVDNTPPSTSLLSPAAGKYFTGSLAASALASDAYGMRSIQFQIDGAPSGTLLTAPDGGTGYVYSQTLSLAGLATGVHTLTDVATDAAGNTAVSQPVTFTIGVPPLAATISSPADWTFAAKTVSVSTDIVGGKAPYAAWLYVDGKPSGLPDTTAPYAVNWDTTKVADGSHTISVVVTDSTGARATSATVHQTVDNTGPTAVMYQPTPGARYNGPTTFQVHASDADGVKSVQFAVDGNPAGALLTRPDPGQQYLYSVVFDASTLSPGSHSVSATVTDNAGNITSATPITIATGPVQYLPVLNYHSIAPPDGYSIYDETPAEADQQLAYLKANGYQSVTLAQYQQWLAGQNIGIAKPVLITVDDGLNDEKAWDSLLQKYGFKAVLFVITGYADNKTPGDADPNNMSWSTIQSLAANGRWEIAFHAGEYGHGDSYDSGAKIGNQSYTAACPYFYSCLSQTTTGIGRNRKTTPETVAAYKTAITNEVTQGIAELKQKVPTASLLAWAAPFNDAGQWTNLYNDPSGQVQSWLPGFMASKFPITFVQTDPTVYGQASGLVGSLTGYGRHYRFEVHTDTTIAQLAASLTAPAFAR